MQLPDELQCGDCNNSQYIYAEENGDPVGKCPSCEDVLTDDADVLLRAIDEELVAEDEVQAHLN